DAGFQPVGSLLPEAINALALQPDGAILAGGVATNLLVPHGPNLVRLRPDGGLDAGFGPSTGFNGTAQALALQPDGKIIAAGNHITNLNPIASLARLNADGSRDSTFTPTGSWANFSPINAVLVQSDGKVVIGGGGGNVTRFNADGGLDGEVR